MGAFYLAWLAALALLAVALNWATTGHHLAHTLGRGLWAVAGMDLLLLATASVAAVTARHLARQPASPQRAVRGTAPQAAHGSGTSHA